MNTLLFNPFEKYSENKLLLFGIFSTFMGGILAYVFNARFDGAIDMHCVSGVTALEVITDLVTDILSLALFLFIAGKIINTRTRIIDIIVTVMVARIALHLLPIFNVGNKLFSVTGKLMDGTMTTKLTADMLLAAVIAMPMLVFILWFFVLLWNGFKVAVNAKGVKPVLLFIVAVLLAEISSKTIIFFL